MKFVGGKDFKVDSRNPNDDYKDWEEFLFKFWYSMGCRPEYTLYQNQEIAVDNLKKVLKKNAKRSKQNEI